MWRSFFLAIGISLCILGGECLVVDKAVLALPNKKEEQSAFPAKGVGFGPNPREVQPPEWAPWSLLSAGVIISIYSVTLARGG